MPGSHSALGVLVSALLFFAGCSSGGSDGGSGASDGGGGSGGSGGASADWQCGKYYGACDCLHGIPIANATPVAACEPMCCGMYLEGTEDEFCHCYVDPAEPGTGFTSCDEYVAGRWEEPGRKVTSCPPD